MTIIKGKRLPDRGQVCRQMYGLSVKMSTDALNKLHLLSLGMWDNSQDCNT